MQWHWQSSWHLVTCGHVMAGIWNVNDETHHIWMSTQQNGYKRLGAACSLFQLRGEVERRSRSQPWEGWNFMSICPPSTSKQILMPAENGDQSGQLASVSIFIIKYLLFSFVVYNFIYVDLGTIRFQIDCIREVPSFYWNYNKGMFYLKCYHVSGTRKQICEENILNHFITE